MSDGLNVYIEDEHAKACLANVLLNLDLIDPRKVSMELLLLLLR